MLKGKKILLGVTGSIAAYKSAVLTRLLIKAGAEVKIIMTPSAHDFITPLTLSTLSQHPVLSEFTSSNKGEWNSHVELGIWADIFLIAPASANTIGKCASGICDNLLLATYLSARCPVIFAPAMDVDMYGHRSTLNNLDILLDYGNHIIPAGEGELASGLTGHGRLEEPEIIVSFIEKFFTRQKNLAGKTILVTAGPTREPIDPVRFIGNHSTGKMGVAIARELAFRGAKVKFIANKSLNLKTSGQIECHNVNTAREMLETSKKLFPKCNAAIFSAAVADYRPDKTSVEKIKKTGDTMNLSLVKNPDIAAELGRKKTKKQVTAGFALETSNAIANAKEKIKSKYFDFIVVNSLEDEGAGFGVDTNKVSILDKSGKRKDYSLKSKSEVAVDIVDHLEGYF